MPPQTLYDMVLKHTDKDYPFFESVTFDNPLNPMERHDQHRWIRDAFDLADIAKTNVLVIDKTYQIELGFRSYRDLAHFNIAHNLPVPHLNKIDPSTLDSVSVDFVSIVPHVKAGKIELNNGKAIVKAFKTAAKKSETNKVMNFEADDDQVVLVFTENPNDYFRFWKAIPEPLKKTLYLTDNLLLA